MVSPLFCFDEYEANLDIVVFDIPPHLLATLQLKDAILSQSVSEENDLNVNKNTEIYLESEKEADNNVSITCLLCSISFQNVQEQRNHVKSDWHGYNLKQKLGARNPVSEPEFEKLIQDLNESISGSESSESENDDEQNESTLVSLLKKQAKINHASEEAENVIYKKRKRGAGSPPLIWFSTLLLPSNTSLGIYRVLFTETELQTGPNIIDVIRQKQLAPVPAKQTLSDNSNGVPLPSTVTSPTIFLCMIGGGHFAAMIVSLAPKMGKKSTGGEERQAIVIAHKTFHRYTTRRKQGGAQSANDSAKGAAHSAGASIRRYNEAALEAEIRALLTEWKELIECSQLVFVRATGNSNRRTLFGPYEGQVLGHNDHRNRSFPFSTRRATQAELMRAFVELTRMKVSQVDEAALAAAAAAAAEREASKKTTEAPAKAPATSPSKEEEEALLHTSQLQALIRRSKVPAILAYLSKNSLTPDFAFHPPSAQANHHAPTPLHLAASINSPAVVHALLSKAGADPTLPNSEGHPSFDLAGDRATRDAFRVARRELGDNRWDWPAAHCPSPLTKTEAEQRGERERADAETQEAERRRTETERLRAAATGSEGGGARDAHARTGVGRGLLGLGPRTGAERREEEARGLGPEARARLERERRARAAEERIRRGG